MLRRRIAAATVTVALVALAFFAGARTSGGGPGEITTTVPAVTTAPREPAPAPSRGDGSTVPATLLAQSRPKGATLSGSWVLSARPSGPMRVVSWELSGSIPEATRASVLEIWQQRRSGWSRVYERRRRGHIGFVVQTADVTQDEVGDALIMEPNGGSGNCGNRLLVSVQDGRAYELFRRYYCEVAPEILFNMVFVSEPIGDCPDPNRSVHCFGGFHIQVLAWAGRERVIDRVHIRCFADLRPERMCRRGP
jgi:hypothetical protein